MTVRFSAWEGFVQEIAAEKEVIDIIRVEVQEVERNPTLTDIVLRAGFVVDDEVRELVMECGVRQEGLDKAESAKRALENACKELGVSVRQGVYV